MWPSAGWRRTARYLLHRLARLPGTPRSIAGGFACGAAISFTPFLGLHFALAALLAWAIRANVVAAAAGTIVGNPWTFPFIWVWIYRFGLVLMGEREHSGLPAKLTFDYVLKHPWEILAPMTFGGCLTGVIAWFAFYYPVRSAVRLYQQNRLTRRLRDGPARIGE